MVRLARANKKGAYMKSAPFVYLSATRPPSKAQQP